jgi:cholest-4-en-3-one 26-monooxygenase
MSNVRTPDLFGPGFDFTDPDRMEQQGPPVEQFARLRRTAPVWWNPQTGGFHDGGFWVVSKHADIRAISRDSDAWSTNDNGVIVRHSDTISKDELESTKSIFINQDPPNHTRLRNLISRLFTPRAVAALQDKLRETANAIVRQAVQRGSGDFVADIAVELPLSAIADLLGVPASDRAKLFHWSNSMMNVDDPEYGGSEYSGAMEASAQLLAYAYQMAEQRKKNPTNDIISVLVNVDADGEQLSELEFGFFVLLLVVAGNETTRNAITHGMLAFTSNPDQWELFKRERPTTTANEIVRWATPVNVFQRTARHEVTVGDVTIAAGQRVGLFYGSANFDEDVFDEPYTFNILRDPNPHLAFGGTGIHYCIGANLARMEIDLMFNAIADVVPDIAVTGEPRRLRSPWLNAIKELSVDYGTPTTR